MQKVLDHLLEEEKEGERIISEAKEKGSKIKTETEQFLSEQNRDLKEQVRLIIENKVTEASEETEVMYRKEIKRITDNPVSLSEAGSGNISSVLEKARGILAGTELL